MKKFKKTTSGKKGGLFVGKSHDDGGIPAIVVDTGQPIEVEGGEVIINKEASKKYWKELSEINQSAGNGVAIPPPMEFSKDVSAYKTGGKISMSEIRKGTEMEMEHAETIKAFKKDGLSVKEVARKIAQDHLKENPNYYKILTKLKLAKGGEVVCRSCGNSWKSESKVTTCVSCGNDNSSFYKTGGKTLSLPEKEKIYEQWKDLVNMSKSEIEQFYNSEDGKKAGLTKEKANALGIDNGRTSARWIMKMKGIPFINWSDEMWRWAKKQINFIKRMSGMKGALYDAKGNRTRKHTSLLIWGHDPEKFKTGGKTIAQTPAPKKDQIFGSKTNKPNSSESQKSAKNITLSEQTIESIKGLLEKHNSKTTKKVDINTAKAVVRRGMGAYSVSHRPTISGGMPNSRVAWGLARLKAFLFKVKTGKSKSGKYSQDNDLIEELGYSFEKFKTGGETQNKPKEFRVEKVEYKRINSASIGGRSFVYFETYEECLNYINESTPKLKAKQHFYIQQYDEDKKDFFYVNGLQLKIKNVSSENKFKGSYKRIFDILEEDAFYNPYGTIYEKLIDGNFYIIITPRPDYDKREKILNISNVEEFESFKTGGQTKAQQQKIGVVMHEFKEGELYSSSGQKVKSPKQAIAIALSEAGASKYAKGSKIPNKNKGGDCYYVAGTIAMNDRLPKTAKEFNLPNFVGTPYVVHAEVEGQGAISGLKYGHAWVEDDLYVYDYSNGREIVFPKYFYYEMGKVKTTKPKYFKYTFEEAVKKMLETGHYGSWELITESGL